MTFRGKHIVITGASSGIGRATALAFAREGARVTLAARNHEKLEAAASDCRSAGGDANVKGADVSNRDECEALIAHAEQIAPIDVLVNNAGYAILNSIIDTPTDEFEAMMKTNYLGVVHCTKAALPLMLARRRGSIVNVASIMGIMGVAGMGAYSATKFAIVGFTESLQAEVAGTGVRVSLVCPGTTETSFFETADRNMVPAASRLVPALSADHVAKAILRAAAKGTPRTILPVEAHLYMRIKEIFPRLAHSVMRNVSKMLEEKRR